MLIGHIISQISSLASCLTDTVYIYIIHGMWNLLAFMSMDSYYIIIIERYYHDNANKLKNVYRSHYLSNKFLSFLPY